MIKYNFKLYARDIILNIIKIFFILTVVSLASLTITSVDITEEVVKVEHSMINTETVRAGLVNILTTFMSVFGVVVVLIGILKVFFISDDYPDKKPGLIMILIGITMFGFGGIIGGKDSASNVDVSFDFIWFWQNFKYIFLILIIFAIVLKIGLIYLYFKAKQVKNPYYLLDLFIETFIKGKDTRKSKYLLVSQELIDSGYDLKSCGKNLAKYFIK